MTSAARRRPAVLVAALFTAAFVLSATVLLTACGGPVGVPPAPGGGLAGKTFSGIAATTLDGKSVDVAQLVAGKVAIVDFWATWCGPCVAAMPHLQALHNRYKDRGFTVVGVMIDKNATRIGPEYVKEKGVNYPIVLDDDGTATEKSVGVLTGIPMLLVIDAQGKILKVFQGFGTPDVLERAVEEAFKGAPAAPAA